MSWEVIPEGEKATVLNAIAEGRCVACYGPIRPEHGGFYCCGCDDGHPDECDGGPDELAYRHPKRGKAHGALVTTRGLLFDPRCHVPRETVAVPVEQIDPADLCKRCWPGRTS